MKKFIRQTSVFLLLCFVSIACYFLILLSITQKTSKSFSFDQKLKTIFLGDSHIQNAINDTLYSGALNLGRNSETTYHSFYKLKAILAAEHNIKNVVLGFGHHNLSNYSDEFILGEKSKILSPPYFYLLPKKDQMDLLFHNIGSLPQYSRAIIRELLKTNNTTKPPFPGKFQNQFSQTSARDSSVLKRINLQFSHFNTPQNNEELFSEMNIAFLDSIQKLASEKGIQLFILNTPVFEQYQNELPLLVFNKYEKLIDSRRLRIIKYDFDESNKSYFIPDGDHLSAEGAIIFTQELKNSSFSFLFNEHSNLN